jgi:hypothetical protein
MRIAGYSDAPLKTKLIPAFSLDREVWLPPSPIALTESLRVWRPKSSPQPFAQTV